MAEDDSQSFHTVCNSLNADNTFYESALNLQEEILDYDEDIGMDEEPFHSECEAGKSNESTGDVNAVGTGIDHKPELEGDEEGEVVSLPEEGECSDIEEAAEDGASKRKERSRDSAEEGECDESDHDDKENIINGSSTLKHTISHNVYPIPLLMDTEANAVDGAPAEDETPWQKAMRQAKLRTKIAKERKAKEIDHNNKRMNMELEEVPNLPTFISGVAGSRTHEAVNGLLPSTAALTISADKIPEEPKENEMLNDYYLYHCRKREDALFLNGRDVVEVAAWQNVYFSADWIRFNMQKQKQMREKESRKRSDQSQLSDPEKKTARQYDRTSDSSESDRDDLDSNSDASRIRSSESRQSSQKKSRRPYIATRNRSPPVRRSIRKSPMTRSSHSSQSMDYSLSRSASRSLSQSRSHSRSPSTRHGVRLPRRKYRSKYRRSSSSGSLSGPRKGSRRNMYSGRSPAHNRGIDPALESRMSQWRSGGPTQSKISKPSDKDGGKLAAKADGSTEATTADAAKEAVTTTVMESPVKRGAHQGPITAGRSRSTSRASVSSSKSNGSNSSSSVSSSSSSSGSSSDSESSASGRADDLLLLHDERSSAIAKQPNDAAAINEEHRLMAADASSGAPASSRQEIRMRIQSSLAKSKYLPKLQKRPASVFHPNDDEVVDNDGLASSLSPPGKHPKLSVPNREEEEEVRRLQEQIEFDLHEQGKEANNNISGGGGSSPRTDKQQQQQQQQLTSYNYREVPPPDDGPRSSAGKPKRSHKLSSEKSSSSKQSNPAFMDNRRDRPSSYHRVSSPTGKRPWDAGNDNGRFHHDARQMRDRIERRDRDRDRPPPPQQQQQQQHRHTDDGGGYMQRKTYGGSSPPDWSALHSNANRGGNKPPNRYPAPQRGGPPVRHDRDFRKFDYNVPRRDRMEEGPPTNVKHPPVGRSPPRRSPPGKAAAVVGGHGGTGSGRKANPSNQAIDSPSAAALSVEKTAALKKRELLEKLRQVEDAIAKKRSKISSN